MAATAPKFRSFYPLESSGLMKNGPLRPVFRRKSVFTRRRVRVGGAGGTKVPFRCNSLRRSTPAGPKGRKVPSGPFDPMGPAGALRAPAGQACMRGYGRNTITRGLSWKKWEENRRKDSGGIQKMLTKDVNQINLRNWTDDNMKRQIHNLERR